MARGYIRRAPKTGRPVKVGGYASRPKRKPHKTFVWEGGDGQGMMSTKAGTKEPTEVWRPQEPTAALHEKGTGFLGGRATEGQRRFQSGPFKGQLISEAGLVRGELDETELGQASPGERKPKGFPKRGTEGRTRP